MSGYKRAAESPDLVQPLEDEQRRLNDGIRVAKKRVKGQGSFNARFWANSQELEKLKLQRTETSRKISLRDFKGTPSEWEQTDEGKSIFQQIKAQTTAIELYKKRSDELDPAKPGQGKRRLRDTFMKLFSTSRMGINVSTGEGTRDSRAQSAFRAELIRLTNAQHPQYDSLWCPILGEWFDTDNVQAAHLFPHMHGQAVMDGIFGRREPPELFSARNGILVTRSMERWFDSGKFVIVPDLPDKPPLAELLAWVQGDTRQYRFKIIDPKWERLDHPACQGFTNKTWRSLDGKKLEFRSSFRPAARYLYFHYCIQVLRQAWGHNGYGASVPILKKETGRSFWGTPGKYMPKNMLLALVEELGHEYRDLLEGAGCSKGDAKLLLEVASSQIKSRPALKDINWDGDHDMEDDSEDEGSEVDSVI
ncbi:hypothetical protein BJX76DRAFT_352568 [Aspergillus varians]